MAHAQAAYVTPLDSVIELGKRPARVGAAIGLVGALILHGGAGAKGAMAMMDIGEFARSSRKVVRARLNAAIDVNFAKDKKEEKKEEPEPPPPPPPDPDPTPQPIANTQPTDEPESAPQAAEAGKVLTAADDPDEPLDLTGDGFVTGDGDRYSGGTTTSTGKSKTAVRNPNAGGTGRPSSTGTSKTGGGPPPAPKTTKNMSRAASPQGTNWNSCGFPAAADMEQIDFARVQLVVTVGANGRATKVSVLSDPGYGFGRLARQCAFRRTYRVALNRSGNKIAGTTPPFWVRFTR